MRSTFRLLYQKALQRNKCRGTPKISEKDIDDLCWYFDHTSFTVYQRTPDIAISEVSECWEGNHTRSVFIQFSLAFYELLAYACISDFADILLYISNYSK